MVINRFRAEMHHRGHVVNPASETEAQTSCNLPKVKQGLSVTNAENEVQKWKVFRPK